MFYSTFNNDTVLLERRLMKSGWVSNYGRDYYTLQDAIDDGCEEVTGGLYVASAIPNSFLIPPQGFRLVLNNITSNQASEYISFGGLSLVSHQETVDDMNKQLQDCTFKLKCSPRKSVALSENDIVIARLSVPPRAAEGQKWSSEQLAEFNSQGQWVIMSYQKNS